MLTGLFLTHSSLSRASLIIASALKLFHRSQGKLKRAEMERKRIDVAAQKLMWLTGMSSNFSSRVLCNLSGYVFTQSTIVSAMLLAGIFLSEDDQIKGHSMTVVIYACTRLVVVVCGCNVAMALCCSLALREFSDPYNSQLGNSNYDRRRNAYMRDNISFYNNGTLNRSVP